MGGVEEATAPELVKMQVRVNTKVDSKENTEEKQKEKRKRKKKSKPQVRTGLFSGYGNGKRIAFGIDVSGSMRGARFEAVILNLKLALESIEDVKGAAFGIVLFGKDLEFLSFGQELADSTPSNVSDAIDQIAAIKPASGNGGECEALKACLRMNPDVVFFLGDGGWPVHGLVQAAVGEASSQVRINSIAFFMTAETKANGCGGMKDISELTGGEFTEINSLDEIEDHVPQAHLSEGSSSYETDSEDGDNFLDELF